MNKVIALLALLAVATPAFAIERGPIAPVRVMNAIRQEAREENKAEGMKVRNDDRIERREVKEEAKIKIMEARKDFKKEREDAKKELKTKLAKIKDTKKRDAVQRIDDNIAALNKKTTDHNLEALSKLTAILDRVSERADRATAKGIDVTTTRTAISDARTAIINADAAVKAQASKSYALAVTDEATLKQKVGDVRQTLRNDLLALQGIMKGVQVSVRKAATTLAQTPRINDDAPEVVSPVTTSTTNQ